MNSHTTFLVFGPAATLRRMSDKMFKEYAPKFIYEHSKEGDKDKLYVAVYEEYEKQINSSVTLTCIFRGSSLSEERNVESNVVDFIIDFGKRFGLTVQEEQISDIPKEDKEDE